MRTRNEIIEMGKEYETKVFSGRNKKFVLEEVFYELAFMDKLNLPSQVKELGIILPTARDLVDGGANYLSTSYCKFHRPLRGSSKESHDQAEMLRQFDMAMFYRTKTNSNVSPWRVANKHAFLHGMWVFETLYDPYAIPEMPVRREDESDYSFSKRILVWNGEKQDRLPLIIRARHPYHVFPEPGTDNPGHVIIKEKRSLRDIKADFPEWTPSASINNDAELEQLTFCDDQYRMVLVDNNPVFPNEFEEHGYGFLPFVIGYSGIGNDSIKGLPEDKAVGLIRHLFGALVGESFAFSVYYIVMRSHAWPIKFVSGPGAKAIANMKFEYGTIYEKPVGTTVEDMVNAPPSETLMDALSYLNSVMAASSAPRSIRGLPETGVRSSVDRSMIMQQAGLKYESVKEQMEISTAKVMSNCTKLAERVVPYDLQIWAHTPDADIDMEMNRDLIKHHYTTYAEFSPTSPEEDSRKQASMMNLMKTGAISADTGRRRYLPHLDPDQEAIKVESERLRANPQVQQILGAVISQELAMEMQRLMKIRQLQQSSPSETQQGISGEGLSQAISPGMRQMQGVSNPPISPGQQTANMVNQRGFLTKQQGGLGNV